jgi:hypothetical protein
MPVAVRNQREASRKHSAAAIFKLKLPTVGVVYNGLDTLLELFFGPE